ncbi:MAG: UDP-N-acetylmuramoyl-tripeptide--D-alanyl-D-alanine ligase [Actinomycetota bacterium]
MWASEAASAVGGRLVGPDVEFDGADFDSRTISVGQLFVPIVADRDGHDFIRAAYERGAALHLTSTTDDVRRDHSAIEVADTAAALMSLAAHGRHTTDATVVGVTGSVGKTSTKDLIAAAAGARKRVVANRASFNNEQGLPVTILGAPDDTEVLVVEMGMRGFGQITRLCEVARPEIGVVTAVGHSHTELVGGIEGVARAKGELVEALPRSGMAILNADDHRVVAMRERTGAPVVTYGRTSDADVRFSDVALDRLARPSFRIDTPWGSADVRLAVSGEHMASNAAAALAVAGSVGVDIDAAAAALADAEMSAMRMQLVELATGALVINDAYNANPTSMVAALDALAAVDADRRLAVVGPMAEIDDPAEGHARVAAHADDVGGIELVPVGTDLYGRPPVEAVFDDPMGVLGGAPSVGARTAILVKASRSAGLERIVQRLVDQAIDVASEQT